MRDLNNAYRREPALHELDFKPEGFEWVDFRDKGSERYIVPQEEF